MSGAAPDCRQATAGLPLNAGRVSLLPATLTHKTSRRLHD
ncbi:hypothetical protein SAMN05444172_3604 [Burkholderia sp. GAS332]|nr:hypothetical protein SAMN05444172_3604 [Burkholderia sp. GAS332]